MKKNVRVIRYKLTDYWISQSQGDIKTSAKMKKKNLITRDYINPEIHHRLLKCHLFPGILSIYGHGLG